MKTDRHVNRVYSLFAAIIVAGILLWIICERQNPLRHLETARVASIRDGDTIELTDGRVVRYVGIDTPEHGHPWFDSATVFNRNLVLGEDVRLEQLGDRIDRYGRTLAVIYVDGQMVNMEILRAGLAWCYFFDGNLKYAKEMIHASREAQLAKRGLWADIGEGDEDEDRYLGSWRGFRFHRPDCPGASRIKTVDVREFPARDSAFFAGYSPCKSCKP